MNCEPGAMRKSCTAMGLKDCLGKLWLPFVLNIEFDVVGANSKTSE